MLIKSVSHCIFLLFLVCLSEELGLMQLPWLSVHLLVPPASAPPRNFSNCQQISGNLERKENLSKTLPFL